VHKFGVEKWCIALKTSNTRYNVYNQQFKVQHFSNIGCNKVQHLDQGLRTTDRLVLAGVEGYTPCAPRSWRD
jgi:hypothetical protein